MFVRVVVGVLCAPALLWLFLLVLWAYTGWLLPLVVLCLLGFWLYRTLRKWTRNGRRVSR
jgi:hypothetical protein